MNRSRWAIVAIAGIALVAVFGFVLLSLLRPPAIPIGAANGEFEHDCCGKIRLRDGRMLLGDKLEVRYAIDRDEKGPFILPSIYAGPWEENGFETDGSRPALKLRLDKLPGPDRIELHGGRKTYVFKRKVFHLPEPAGGLAHPQLEGKI